MKVKYLIKSISTIAVIGLSYIVGRNASANLSIDESLLQMQNIDYIPQLNNTYTFVNLLVWLVAFLLFCLIWRKEIKKIFD